MREERPALVAARPGLKIGEVTKVLAAKWNKLGPAEKEKFVKLADEDKDRYLEEMKVWKAKQPAQEEEDEEDEEEGEEEEEEEEDEESE